MELIDQHTKKIMEGCKERARDAGLRFQNETLEYVVTNRDLLELSPKVMIPTLYDYWVHDVDVLKEKGKYELYPSNPYETVINTRPAISFYNDNNPDWLNVMIFYHVLAHVDFFQNNLFFRHTWDFDLAGEALADKRLIARLRSEKGRWVDYVIEFSRGIDNLVGYFNEVSKQDKSPADGLSRRVNFYFDTFLQVVKQVKITDYVREIERYNECIASYGELGETTFFAEVVPKYPEFEALLSKADRVTKNSTPDLLRYLMEHSPFLNRDENLWMKSVIEVVRKTSLYFQPQIRTKIMNEGWASYWHEKLFLEDERIKGHEVDFARVHAGVTSLPRVGLNPYALGMRLFSYIEELGDKGKLSYEFSRVTQATERDYYDRRTGCGRSIIFDIRENHSDFSFIKTFIDQDFLDRHHLFVSGKKLDQARMVWEYYVKSRKAEDYRQMLLDTLYHPPHVSIDSTLSKEGNLYIRHHCEGKPLVQEFIGNTMLGIEYLWGSPVNLETSEVHSNSPPSEKMFRRSPGKAAATEDKSATWRRVLYRMENRKLTRKPLEGEQQ